MDIPDNVVAAAFADAFAHASACYASCPASQWERIAQPLSLKDAIIPAHHTAMREALAGPFSLSGERLHAKLLASKHVLFDADFGSLTMAERTFLIELCRRYNDFEQAEMARLAGEM